jgi:hypothetical protein
LEWRGIGYNHGLKWGVEDGARFNYTVEVSYRSETLDLDVVDEMYVIIDGLHGIPDHGFGLSELVALYTTYWSNGTVMDQFWFVIHEWPFDIFPIGNWSLVRDYFLDSAYNEVIENESLFIALSTYSSRYNYTNIYMKNDGAIAYYRSYRNITEHNESLSLELTREGFVPPTITHSVPTGGYTTLLFLGLLVAAPVAILAAIAVRRKYLALNKS